MADFLHIVKTESFDVDAMNHLCNYDGLSTDMKALLKKYKKNRKNINEVQVVYDHGKNWRDLKHGRLIGDGLQGFDKEIRATLANKYYWDLDVVNAQPVILVQMCKRNGWACPNLDKYVNERDAQMLEIMNDMNVKRDDVKGFFIQILFGSKIAWHLQHPFLIAITREMTIIMENVALKHPEILKRVTKIYKSDPTKKGKDPKAGCIAQVVQNEEAKVLRCIDTTLQKHARDMQVFIHDGGLVRKLENELEFPRVIMKKCQAAVFEELDYNIQLAIKSMSEKVIQFKGKAKKYTPNDTLISDSYAAKKFVELLDENVVLDIASGRWIFDDRTGQWSQDDQVLRNYLNIYASDMIFYQVGDSGDKISDYSGKESNIKNMIANIDRHLSPIDFLNTRGDSAVGKFLFENGIYDMKTKTFTEGFDPKYVFFARIPRNYQPIDEDLCHKVHKLLFEDPYIMGEQDVQATWFKRGIARALYGDVLTHKNCYITVGQPNCGRGLLTSALQQAFGDYVKQFSPNALIYNANNSSDEAKKLAWVVPLANSRLCIGNEVTMDQKKYIDGGQLKVLSGGGDSVTARLNFKDGAVVPIRTIFLLQTNDIPSIKPADEAVMNRVIINELRKSYKETPNPANPNEMKQDAQLKNKFMTEEYKNAVFHLMANIYGEWVADGSAMTKPECLKALTSEWIETTTSIRSILESKYEITGNPEHYVSSRELIDFLKSKKCVESDTKIGRELSVLKCNVLYKKVNGISKSVRTGIREIMDALVIDDEPTVA